MTEYKNYGQAGAFGKNPRSDANIFTQSHPANHEKLVRLADEISLVRKEMKKRAAVDDLDHDEELGIMAQAEKAAKSGDNSQALGFLKNVGQWTLDVAKSITAELVKDAIEGKF